MKIDLGQIQQEYVSLVTRAGILTIEELSSDVLRISLSERFTLSIQMDEDPIVTLDSDERPTRLKLAQSLSKWIIAEGS